MEPRAAMSKQSRSAQTAPNDEKIEQTIEEGGGRAKEVHSSKREP